MLSESIDIAQLGERLYEATNDMIFAGVVALTRTAKHCQTAIRDQLPDIFNIRNKWTIQGIPITPATKQTQESEVYSKDWYMPVHEEGGKRAAPYGKNFWIPVGIREAIGINIKQIIPTSYRARNLLKNQKKIYGNKPFLHITRTGLEGIFVRTAEGKSIKLLYLYYLNDIKIAQRK